MGLTNILKEAITLSNFKDYSKAVAYAYKARPNKGDSKVMRAYDVLNRHNHKMFKRLQSRVDVKFTSDEPYDSASEMKRKVKETGVMYINTDHSDNLNNGWSEKDNWIFRAVHDYIVHIGGDHDFSLRGEIGAFNTHAKIAPPDAIPVLFSEVVAQVCYVEEFGDFPDPQKACILYGFDYDQLGEVNWDKYRDNFTLNPIRTYSKGKIDSIIKKVKF